MLLALITPTNASLASRPSFSGSEIGVPPPPQPRRRSSTSSDIHELLTVDVSIKTEGDGGEKIVKSVVDSGAQVTVMTLSAARRLSYLPLINRSLSSRAIGVGVGSIIGRIEGVTLNVGGVGVSCDVAVLEDGDREGVREVECLVGLDVLSKLEAVIDVRKGMIIRGGRRIPWVNEGSQRGASTGDEQTEYQSRQTGRDGNHPAGGRNSRGASRSGSSVPSTSLYVPQKQPLYNPSTNTYIPPVDLEVEAELDQLDDCEIEDIIRREDEEDWRGMERKYDYINGQGEEEEEEGESESDLEDFDMAGV